MASHDELHFDYDAAAPRSDPLARLASGGIGTSTTGQLRERKEQQAMELENSLRPGRDRSLSGIAMRAFLLGMAMMATSAACGYVALVLQHPLWRLPFMIAVLSLFHFLEFWTTARYNTRAAQVDSYLLSSNGNAYRIAHTAALVECAFVMGCWPERQWLPPQLSSALMLLGLLLVVAGQLIRTVAMIHAGSNFNHVVQWRKENTHQLVTTGIYGRLRHPSYFGYYWWAMGTQLVLGNPICFVAYAWVLWKFFSARISEEERLLVQFFGDQYRQYRKRTIVGIPFIT